MNKRKQTPWAVICPEHGQVFLTNEEYDAQMDAPDSVWRCPCGTRAEWDDDNYEAMARDDDFSEEGTA